MAKGNKEAKVIDQKIDNIGEDVSWMTNVLYSQATTSQKITFQNNQIKGTIKTAIFNTRTN